MEQAISSKKNFLLWSLLAIYFVLSVFVHFNTKLILAIYLLGITFGLLHGSARYGFKKMLAFLAICVGVSVALENTSVLTGFPFGHYHYTDVLPGPRIYFVPLVIILAYFSSGYCSWVLANIILDNPDENPKSNYFKFAVPLITAFIMTMWDVCMDPRTATIAKFWIWHDGGGFFGVPLSNYLGWFICVWLYAQLFALYLSKTAEIISTKVKKSYWYQAICLYFIIGLSQLYPFIFFNMFNKSEPVTDAIGKVWQTCDIRETAVILFLYTMLFVSVFSFMKIYRKDKN